jgi:undecaprenyl-diphosphatase
MNRSSLTHWTAFSAPLLALLVIVWFNFTSEAEVSIYFSQHRATHPLLSGFMQFVTDWSNIFFYGFFGIMLIKAYRSGNREKMRFVLILLVIQALIAGLAVHFLKSTIGRPRPGQGQWFDPLTSRGANHSLPSGHTTEITGWSLPLVLKYRLPWLTLIFGLVLGVVGFSRIYLGWHHPSDVFFGWLLGSFGGFATTIIANSSLFKKGLK